MQIQAKIGGISYDRSGKPANKYLDLEADLGTRFQLQITNNVYT